MRATVCAALLALLVSACATSAGSHQGGSGRAKGVVHVHASLNGGPPDPKSHRGVLDNKPVPNARISVANRAGRHWYVRTTRAGTGTFTLPPGRYLMTSDWCGARRIEIKVLPGRVLPVRYACLLR